MEVVEEKKKKRKKSCGSYSSLNNKHPRTEVWYFTSLYISMRKWVWNANDNLLNPIIIIFSSIYTLNALLVIDCILIECWKE